MENFCKMDQSRFKTILNKSEVLKLMPFIRKVLEYQGPVIFHLNGDLKLHNNTCLEALATIILT